MTNILANNAIILVEIAVALAVGGLIMLVFSLVSTYWSKYSEKLSVERQLADQLLPEMESTKKKKPSLIMRWDRYWEMRLVNSGLNIFAANRENAGRIIIYVDLGLTAVLTLIFQGSILGALIIVLALNIVAAQALGFVANKKMEKMSGQVPEFLSALSSANDSGAGNMQAVLLQAIGTTPAELHEELKPVEDNLIAGGQLKAVLMDFYNKTAVDELRFLVACIIMANDSGKDIKNQLTIIQDVVNSRMEVNRHLKTAIASIMPTVWIATIFIPGMFLYTYLFQPIARTFWFHSLISWVLLAVVIGLYLLGIWIAKHQIDNIRKL
jgi:Flp pilus assembly protein TadB